MRIINVLKDLNIGLETLNNELSFLGIHIVSINDKISEKDYAFLKNYFASEELKQVDRLNMQIKIQREALKKLFLKNNPNPRSMGEFERRQYFNLIIKNESHNITMPKVKEYSEENFWKLISWYENWMKKSLIERENAIIQQVEEIVESRTKRMGGCVIDEEAKIMSALSHGEGDIFGF